MRWPWEQRRELAAPPVEQRRRRAPDPGATGSDDNKQAYGWLRSDDPNPLFHGRQRFDVYDEMRKSDASVRSTLWMTKLPMRSATWTFSPPRGSTDPTDELVADACSALFGVEDRPARLSTTWDETLSQELLVLDFGCMFGEVIWPDEPWEWRDANGNVHVLWAPMRIAPRYPRTVDKIETDPLTGQISVFKQWLPGAKPIPPEKLVVQVLDKESDWFGTSLLRPMYGPWKLKKELMIAAGIGWDRFAAGIPVMEHPSGDAAAAKAARIARNVRTHEHAYVAHEGGESGWKFRIEGGAGSLPDPTPLLRLYCEQIAEAGLQQFSSLGTTASGNRAVGEVLVEPFYQACQAVAGQVAAVLTRDVVRPFVDVNFGVNVPTPTLAASRIAVQNISTLTQAVSDLHAAGLSFDDLETQNDLRGLLEMRALPEDFTPSSQRPGFGEGGPPLFQ